MHADITTSPSPCKAQKTPDRGIITDRRDDVGKFLLESAYAPRNRAQNIHDDPTNLHFIHASRYYGIMRGRGELKFTAFDLPNQNRMRPRAARAVRRITASD